MVGVLEGQHVLITGAGRGLGEAYAELAASEGASVAVNDADEASARSVAERLRRGGARALAVPGSVTSPEQVEVMVARAEAEFGPITGLVNNAGITDETPALVTDLARFARVLEVHVLGAATVGLAVARSMVAHGVEGSIVNVTSGSAQGIPTMSAYGAAKGAVNSLTYVWALELLERGIRVNALSPVAFTPDAETSTFASKSVPRSFTSDRVAPAAVWLLSPASGGVTGQIVRFDGVSLGLQRSTVTTTVQRSDSLWSVNEVGQAFARSGVPWSTFGLFGTAPPAAGEREN